MTFPHLNRRLHLYLGLALVPWFAMYALSALVMSHRGLIERLGWGEDEWTLRFDRPYDADLAPDADESARRALARRVVDEHGLECVFHAGPIKGGRIDVLCSTFFAATRFNYDLNERRLTAEDTRLGPLRVLTRMHSRAGFHHDRLRDDLWAVMVDLVSVGLLLWVVSGLYMWWNAPGQRRWGTVALVAGFSCFIAFMLGL
ncbi:MAG TPA: hypothetical protein VFG08_05725 [Candidatus Polarisedimenticolia bacterium]|nr:hypothetical protein [Candidatus Polarisedimenticolia bacterium]